MWYRNDGKEEADNLQNHFTAYLLTAVRRRKKDYITQKNRLKLIEYLAVTDESKPEFSAEQDLDINLPLLMRLENDRLVYALKCLNERELQVFLGRVLDEMSFEELSIELGLSYKGVAAVYYRTIQKIKNKMRKMDK